MSLTRQLPAIPRQLIQTSDALLALCDQLRAARCFAFDTEFIGENTYQPILCLVQVATHDRVELIDPFALQAESPSALQPLWQLLADPSIEKICHAGNQDVEIAWLQSHLTPQNIFDTQIGAGMLGIAYPTALWRVVEHFSGVTLEKAHTYSAWDRRPLSKPQLAYAVDDVRYLPTIHALMKERIDSLNHLPWMLTACHEMCTDSAKPSDARKLFLRIRGAASFNSDQLSVLRELTALREQLAYEHNLPPRSLLKDDALVDIATRMPEKEANLSTIRDIPRDFLNDYTDELLDAVARGLAVPHPDRPAIHIPPEDSAEVKRLAETLWVAAQVICLGQSVTPALVTSQNEILSLARLVHKNKHVDSHPLLTGWHRECLGDKLLAFIRGQLLINLSLPSDSLLAAFSPIPPA